VSGLDIVARVRFSPPESVEDGSEQICAVEEGVTGNEEVTQGEHDRGLQEETF
jgi:hypothetical protein